MRLSDVPLITFAIVGFTSIIAPMDEPTPELWDALIMAFRACLLILLSAVPCVAILIGINFVAPDADPDLITNVAIVVIFVSMVVVKIIRRHFVKKYGYRVASSEKVEIRN